jgi:hypothetical protein
MEKVYINKLTFNYAKWKEKKESLKIFTAIIKCKEKRQCKERCAHITLTLNSLTFTKSDSKGISAQQRLCKGDITISSRVL